MTARLMRPKVKIQSQGKRQGQVHSQGHNFSPERKRARNLARYLLKNRLSD